ncbi:DUF6415 family natural product biosynthesis protein [Streptomyces thermoalcalitolerans]|uniref:DUF6415 family natural product biosynthesis protein n=1 Tax=Streptomyces thermoalcalitolerans TaxID=65605 RepID=UPI0031E36D33
MKAAPAAIRAWQPYDGNAWLDDVGDALDSVPPAEDRVDELAQRLRGYLTQLVNYAVNSGTEAQDSRTMDPVARARALRAEKPPGDYHQGVVHLRRLGRAVNELHDLLVEQHVIKGPDSLNEPPQPASLFQSTP